MEKLVSLMESIVPEENLIEYTIQKSVGLLYATVRLTPQLASKWRTLAHERQRNIRWDNIAKLKHVLENQQWDPTNGENMKFDNAGICIDGIHRCTTCEITKAEIICQVVFGCGNKAFANIDTGAIRTAGNTLQVMGFSSPNQMAAIAKKILSFQINKTFSPSVTSLSISKFVEENTDIMEYCRMCANQSKPSIQMSIGGFLAFHYCQINKELTSSFFDDYRTMSTGFSNAPAVLYKTINDQKAKNKKVHLLGEYIAAISIKALNAYFMGENVKLLRWSKSENFPEFTKKFVQYKSKNLFKQEN